MARSYPEDVLFRTFGSASHSSALGTTPPYHPSHRNDFDNQAFVRLIRILVPQHRIGQIWLLFKRIDATEQLCPHILVFTDTNTSKLGMQYVLFMGFAIHPELYDFLT